MKRVLCFGDSNTYGYAPYDGRYAADARWPGCLAARLGPGWQVIEAGLNGRTAGAYDALWPEKNGAAVLPAYLRRYQPLHWLIVMLGGNDALSAPAGDIAADMETLLQAARQHAPGCAVLLLAPPAPQNDAWCGEAVRGLPPLYQALAARYGARFADTNAWQPALAADGCHLAPAGHRAFAARLAAILLDAASDYDKISRQR